MKYPTNILLVVGWWWGGYGTLPESNWVVFGKVGGGGNQTVSNWLLDGLLLISN